MRITTVHLVLTVLSFCSTVRAQNIDSIKQMIRNSPDDSTQTWRLNSLAWTLKDTKPDTAILVGNQAIKLSERFNSPQTTAKLLTNLGVYHQTMGDHSTALTWFNKAVELRNTKRVNDADAMAGTYHNIGISYFYLTQLAKALEYENASAKINGERNDSLNLANNYIMIGAIHKEQSDYPKALENYFKAANYFERSGQHSNGLAVIYNNIGEVFYLQSRLPEDLEYQLKAFNIRKALNNKAGMADSYVNIGAVNLDMGDYVNALANFHKSVALYNELGNRGTLSFSFANLGDTYTTLFSKGDHERSIVGKWAVETPSTLLDSALSYYQSALEISKKFNIGVLTTYTLKGIGMVYYLKDQYAKAETNYSQAASLADKLGFTQRSMEAYKGLSDTYQKWASAVSDYRLKTDYLLKSIQYRDRYTSLKDSIFNEEKQKNIGRLEAKHEYELSAIKADQEKRELLRQETETKSRRNTLQYSASLLIIFLLFVGLFLLGKMTLPKWIMEFSIFIPILILFEFLLVLTDPVTDRWTNGEPGFKLLTNAAMAGMIFPIQIFFERILKKHFLR